MNDPLFVATLWLVGCACWCRTGYLWGRLSCRRRCPHARAFLSIQDRLDRQKINTRN